MNLIKKITYITLFGLTIFSCNSEKKVNISEDSAKDAFNKLTNLVDGFAENSIQKGNANSFADRKSTRLNSSHGYISYAVFCLKKKKKTIQEKKKKKHT